MVTFHADVQPYDSADLLETAGGVGWNLDPARAAVLVHDMQPYYLRVLPPQVREKVVEAVIAVTEWGARHEAPSLPPVPDPRKPWASAAWAANYGVKGPLLRRRPKPRSPVR